MSDGLDDPLAELEAAAARLEEAEHAYGASDDRARLHDPERDELLAAADAARQQIRTLCDILIQRGQLIDNHRRLLERIVKGPARPAQRIHLRVVGDKHDVAGPGIDCASRLHLCEARCCRLQIELAREDLDDGIRFAIDRPYLMLKDAEGWCHYLERATGGCGIYDVRPTTCRRYDCRHDKRIWLDFAAGIPAPLIDI